MSLNRLKNNPQLKHITFAIQVAVIYHIWTVRNLKKYEGKHIQAANIFQQVKDHVNHRTLHLAYHSTHYAKIIDRVLG